VDVQALAAVRARWTAVLWCALFDMFLLG